MIVSELFLTDRDGGLFKQILLKSKVMQGRYFIMSSGQDIYNSDLTTLVPQTYPCVVLTPFRSTINGPDYTKESLPISLYFITKTKTTGDGQIKQADPQTLTPGHFFWQDWKDMKECAQSFLKAFQKVTHDVMVGGQPLRGICALDTRVNPTIIRFANTTSNIVSGAQLNFTLSLNSGCDNDDYAAADLSTIQIPVLNLHPLHNH